MELVSKKKKKNEVKSAQLSDLRNRANEMKRNNTTTITPPAQSNTNISNLFRKVTKTPRPPSPKIKYKTHTKKK